MKVKELTFASILTAIIIAIEVLAATTGEALVALTVFSALPIYIICRKSTTFGLTSYICVGFILLQVNFHQLIFFIFTNGLLGISLGLCDKKLLHSLASIIISNIVLFIGIIVTFHLLGIFIIQWYIGILIFLFACIYVTCYRFLAKKIYEKLNTIENFLKR